MTKRTRFLILIISILVIGAVFRLWQWNEIPPAPYWEEVALGYDAWSVLQTGADHHGNVLPIVAFESFGDWKPSLYFYAVAAAESLFGLSVTAVRIPSLLSGLSLIPAVMLLAKWATDRFAFLTDEDRFSSSLPLIAAGFAGLIQALSPWAIHMSRGGWESHLATALVTWGIVALWHSLRSQRNWSFLIGAVLLALSLYAYHATRIVAPLIGLGAAGFWFRQQLSVQSGTIRSKITKVIHRHWKLLLLSTVVVALLVAPLVWSLTTSQVTQRFAETSRFTDLSIIEQSNTLRESAGNTWWSRILYHRYWFYMQSFLQGAFDHLRLDFLFLHGDENPRHGVGYMGLFPYLGLPLLMAGSAWLYRHRSELLIGLWGWYLLAIIPAALTKTTPHTLRVMSGLPALAALMGIGGAAVLYWVWLCSDSLKRYMKVTLVSLVSLALLAIFAFEATWFWRYYSQIYPVRASESWQYGYAEMFEALDTVDDDREVFISRSAGRPAMYYWFYNATDPREVQTAADEVEMDQSEFLSFQDVIFTRGLNSIASYPAGSVVVGSPSEIEAVAASQQLEILHSVDTLDGTTTWQIGVIQE